MSVLRLRKNIFHHMKNIREYSLNNAEASIVEYPPIEGNSYHEKKERELQQMKNIFENVATVEEKLIKLNMPRYYGWKTLMLRDNNLIPYNALPLIKYCTRSHLYQQSLPEYYNQITINQDLIENIKQQIKEAIFLQYRILRPTKTNLSPSEHDDKISSSFVSNVNRIVLNTLSKSFPHLQTTQYDVDPRHEAFWFIGGFPPNERLKKARKNSKTFKYPCDIPADNAIQYIGNPIISLRSEFPLPQIVSMNEATDITLKIPKFEYDPRVLGYDDYEFRHGTNIPGFWPGESAEFGLLSVHRRGHLLNRSEKYGSNDNQEALHAQAITASFSWLLSQACYQGFSIYNDINYPLVTQTIITNGQLWSFYVYQLNTILLISSNSTLNPRRNLCWGTKEMRLFESIDNDGNIVGFNKKVIEFLIKLYANVPKQRFIEMKPCLKQQEKVIADIENEEKRVWLEEHFKHMMSNRPRHKLPYEIYHWEKIYKIDHKTRPLEARRRPFELDINPYKRTVDDHLPKYVPRKLRPEGTKSRKYNRWEKSYYP